MKGTVLYGPRDIRCEARADSTIVEPTDAIIRMATTCVCGSDLWPYRGINPTAEPTPMGHEYCGFVEEVGKGVTSIKRGQFVIGSQRREAFLHARPLARRAGAGAALPPEADRSRPRRKEGSGQGLRPHVAARPGRGRISRDGRAPRDQEPAHAMMDRWRIHPSPIARIVQRHPTRRRRCALPRPGFRCTSHSSSRRARWCWSSRPRVPRSRSTTSMA
jgi:hypothetical protein